MRLFVVFLLSAGAGLLLLVTSATFEPESSETQGGVSDPGIESSSAMDFRSDDVRLAKIESSQTPDSSYRKRSRITLMKFGATWCPPCRMIDEELSELSRQRLPISIRKIDVDENPRMARKYEVSNIPRLILVVDGRIVGDETGFMTSDQLLQWIDSNAPSGWEQGQREPSVRRGGMQANPFFQ